MSRVSVESGELSIEDIDRSAFTIWSSFLGFNLNISHADNRSVEEADKLFDVHIKMVFEGIRK